MKSIRKSVKGFTFTELIVVMAIIAVLTATLVMAVGGFLRDKKYDDANAKAETIYRALQIKLNQYDAEGHTTIASDGSEVEGVGGVPRQANMYIYIGNFNNTGKIEANIGMCREVKNSGGTVMGLDSSVSDARGCVTDFDMGDTIRTIYIKRSNANVDWNPSWMAKVDMETYTVEYVLYTEDNMHLDDSFLDRTGTADENGYYVDVYEQQASSERARLEYNVVGCYPMQSFYN